MKKENILFAVAGIFIGFFGGFFLANSINRREISRQNVPQNTVNAPFQNPQTQAVDIKESQTQGKPLPEVAEKIDRAKNEPNNFDAQLQAGNLYLQIKGTEKAGEFFDKAAQLNPTDYKNIVDLGNAFFDIGKYEKAEKWYQQALEKKPDDVNVRTDLGVTFVERQTPDLNRAIQEFQTVLKANPKFEPALYNLGIAFFKKGDQEQAVKVLSELENLNPQGQSTQKLREKIGEK